MSDTNFSYSGSYPGIQYGTVFTTPSLADLSKSFKYNPTQTFAYPGIYTGSTVSPETKSKEAFDFETWQKMQQVAAKTSADSTRQQMSDLFPYLSAASAEATARNLAASTQFLLTKEQTPTAQALRNQVAQGQIATSAGAEADRDRATAAQAQAAKNFARSYIESLPSRA